MSDISISVVQSKPQQKQFLMLPWEIYSGDQFWIPPIRQNQKELCGFAKHPFYDDADSRAFLAFKNGKPCGRVLALINHAHNRRYNENIGFFGFFESIDDQEVANELFDAAKQWFSERGITQFRGPCNPSLNYELGLLVDGFDSSPFFMMTYNPRYYETLVENYGFKKKEDLYAYWGHVNMLETLDEKIQWVVDQAIERLNIKLRRIDTKNFAKEVRMFLEIYNKSLVGTWGFVPLSEGEVDHIADSMRHMIVPEMTSVAEIDGKTIGAIFGLLDFNPRVKKIDGRLFPFGFLRLLWNKKAIKSVRLISTNVLPEYQRWGVGVALMSRLVPDIHAWGIEEAEFSWVLESNTLSRGTLERGGAKRTKTYRLYDYTTE